MEGRSLARRGHFSKSDSARTEDLWRIVRDVHDCGRQSSWCRARYDGIELVPEHTSYVLGRSCGGLSGTVGTGRGKWTVERSYQSECGTRSWNAQTDLSFSQEKRREPRSGPENEGEGSRPEAFRERTRTWAERFSDSFYSLEVRKENGNRFGACAPFESSDPRHGARIEHVSQEAEIGFGRTGDNATLSKHAEVMVGFDHEERLRARQPMSRRQCLPVNVMRSAARYTRSAACWIVSPVAVTASTRPPAVTTVSPRSPVPA